MIDWQNMSPFDWVIRPLKRYADFNGRAPRAEYWWFVLFNSVTTWVLAFVDSKAFSPVLGNYGPLRLSLIVAMLLPIYAVTVRRLHDTDSSAWWALPRIGGALFLLAPLLRLSRFSFQEMSGWQTALLVVIGLGWACAEIALFVFMVCHGTLGTNSYGPDPYGGHDELEEVFA